MSIHIRSAVPLNLYVMSNIFTMLYSKNLDNAEQQHDLLMHIMQWDRRDFRFRT